jgi:flagellar basal-body rod modification protein FlgD
MSTTAVQSSTSATGTTVKNSKMALKTEDFIKMMVTQLQNQDPMEPAKNQELLAQMSQIGQLQSSESLQSTLAQFGFQSQLASAGNLIGKTVTGLDDQDKDVNGVVTGIRVEKDQVNLELDTGGTLKLARVTAIEGTPVKAAS